MCKNEENKYINVVIQINIEYWGRDSRQAVMDFFFELFNLEKKWIETERNEMNKQIKSNSKECQMSKCTVCGLDFEQIKFLCSTYNIGNISKKNS